LIEVYTDGSCLGNPGAGGWSFLILNDGKLITKSGSVKNSTNNRMELTAAIKALEYLKDENSLRINTDSNYLKNGINEWIFKWKKNNWLNSKKEPVKNKTLWIELDLLTRNKDIYWNWVKAHNDDKFNNMVDSLAREAAKII
tara:strand:- start:2487 stop:2912 length:426 start_codon:yes stop_codon:yes gene_type:complete